MSGLLRILIITGLKSFDEISQIANKINKEEKVQISCRVLIAPVDVSAFMQPAHVIDLCSSLTKQDYDLILVPGFTTWDTKDLSEIVSIPVYKGTRFSGDLYDLLCCIRDIALSTKKAADYLLRNHSKQKIDEHIKTITEDYSHMGQPREGTRILRFVTPRGRQILTGGDFPPLLIAEIVDSPKLSDSDIMEKVQYYVSSGADVIDLGMIHGQSHPERIRNLIPRIKKTYDILVSVDSVEMNEMIAGIESGVDMILSIDGENIHPFLEYARNHPVKDDIGIILIPLNRPDHKAIEDPIKKAEFLISLAQILTSHGFKNLFYDALLQSPISPGLTESLNNYYILNHHITQIPSLNYPTFIGLHNVFELVDVDSSGLIGLLTLIALELHCAGIFTTEFSPKTLGSVKDTKRSIELGYYAKISKSPPTNLGIDGFSVKSKRKSLERMEKPAIIIDLSKEHVYKKKIQQLIEQKYEFIHDTTGYFKIYANHKTHLIEAFFIPFDETKKRLSLNGPLLLKGSTAESLYKAIFKLGLVREISHAFYLGKELSKAEFALYVNAAYFEDTDLE